jgi:hypothetical protein
LTPFIEACSQSYIHLSTKGIFSGNLGGPSGVHVGMALYYFDFKNGIPVRDRFGRECANDEESILHGNTMARRIGTARPETIGRGCYISVLNESSQEIHQAPVQSDGNAIMRW